MELFHLDPQCYTPIKVFIVICTVIFNDIFRARSGQDRTLVPIARRSNQLTWVVIQLRPLNCDLVSQQAWYDKDPSLLKGHKCRLNSVQQH